MTLQSGVRRAMGATLVAALMLAAAAQAEAGRRIYVRVGPPVPVVEVRAVAPGSRYVWTRGYHRWDRRAYVWVPGRWVVPPRRHAAWVAPRWVSGPHGWHFVAGYWR